MNEHGEVLVGAPRADRRAPTRRRSGLLALVIASALALTACGPTTLWAWGGNSFGAVGDGTADDRRSPTEIGTDTNWTTVSAGGSHTVAIRTDGTLWAWGSNFYGQLGDGTTTNRFVPTQIGTGTNWKAVDAGGSHTVAIRTDGTLWTWGQRLECLVASVDGCTTDPSHLVPTQVGAATNWATASAGAVHAVAIRTDGTLWTWGRRPECFNWPNYCDDLGVTAPTQIGAATNWATVSAGTFHTLGTRTDGTLWGWGDNLYRQIGIGVGDYPFVSPVPISTDTNWKSVSAGGIHSTAIRTDGTLWVWGGNNRGQQGIGEELSSAPSPYQVGTDTNWATVSAGSSHTAATRTPPSAP